MIICKKYLNPVSYKVDPLKFPNYDIIMIISVFGKNIYHERIFFVSFYKPPNINFKINQ